MTAQSTSLTNFEPGTHTLSLLERAQSATQRLKVGAGGTTPRLKVRPGGPPGLKVGDGGESPGEGPQ
jgi:hypothetical protein